MRPALTLLLRCLAIPLLAALGACSVQQERLPPDDILAASRAPARDTTIALLGGTGFAGGYILREALAQGYALRVLSRSPGKLTYLGDRVTVIEGDARNPESLASLLEGADVVVSAIGPPRSGGDSRGGLNSEVTRALLSAMADAGLERYIVVSGAGVVMPGDRRDLRGWWMRQLVRVRYPGILQDRQAEFALLADSSLDWTLVRCPLIEGQDFVAAPQVSLATPGGFYLRAGELARFVVRQVEDPGFVGKGPILSSE